MPDGPTPPNGRSSCATWKMTSFTVTPPDQVVASFLGYGQELLRQLRLPPEDLARFFEQVAFSVMVRNGDAHLKNFGVLYDSRGAIRLSPMFDVVTTAIYRYARSPGGPLLEDRTMALKLFAGRHRTKTYPTTDELVDFGRRICGVRQPARVLQALADAMQQTLAAARGDERIPAGLLEALTPVWSESL